MTRAEYLHKVELYNNYDSIDDLIERAANDDSITNGEYEEIVSAAIDKIRRGC